MNQPINTRICRPRASSIDGRVHLSWIKRTQLYSAGRDDGTAEQPWHFRVLRRTETQFTRNEDYEEYFLGLGSEGAEVIFEGEMVPENQRRFTLVDQDVAYRTTYSYFIEAANDRCVGPIGVRVTDPEIYWTYDRLNAELAALAAEARDLAELSVCGHTGAGRSIPCLTIGRKGPRLALVGLMHAGESGPELIVPLLRRLVGERRALFDAVQVVALPSVNLDGRELQARGTPWYIRQTPAGVDLNRNFPADWEMVSHGYGQHTDDPASITWRGAEAGGAPEVKAVMAALTQYPPDITLSYHALASVASLPAYNPEGAASDQSYQARCREVIRVFGSGLFPGQPYHERWTYPGSSASGSLGMWLYKRYGTPAFDLEMLPPIVEWDEIFRARRDQTDRPMLASYQSRHTDAVGALLVAMSGGLLSH